MKADTCVGYNTLFVAPDVPVENGKDLPQGTRLWSWLILCDDGKEAMSSPRLTNLDIC